MNQNYINDPANLELTFYNYMKQKQSTKLQNTPQNKQLIGLDLGNTQLRIAHKNKEINIRSTLFIQNSNIYVNKRPSLQCLTDSVMLMDYKFQSESLQHIIKYYNCHFSKGTNQNTIVKLSDLTFIQQFYFQFAVALIIKGSLQTNTILRYLISQREIKMVVTFFAGKINPFRLGLKSCLKLAGIEDCSFVSTSACIAANFLKSNQKSRDDTDVIGVIDFGSQGLSFSCYKLYHMEIGVIENLFQDNTFLGGSKLTNLLVDYTVDKLIKDKGMDITKNPQLMHRLRLLSEQAKCVLSSNEMAFIRLDGLPDILMYGTQISVQQFQKCIQKLMLENFNIIKNGLLSLKQKPKKIIITGNSCKIPLFRKLLSSIVKKQDIIQANQDHLRRGILTIKTKDLHLIEICHFQLRVQGDEKLHQILIKKGEVIPTRKKLALKFPSGQLTFSLKFYQNNELVATSFIPGRPRQNSFNLYVEIDYNKMLSIYATTSQGLIKMNTNMLDLPREEYIKYDQLMRKVDFHIENE